MPSPAGKHDDFESPGPAITTYSAAVEFVSLPKGVGGRLRLVSHYANSFIQEAVGLTGWLLLGWKFSGLISILFPQRISSRENLIKDQSIFPLVIMIILLFLITFSFNNVLLLSEENWYWQSWNLKVKSYFSHLFFKEALGKIRMNNFNGISLNISPKFLATDKRLWNIISMVDLKRKLWEKRLGEYEQQGIWTPF